MLFKLEATFKYLLKVALLILFILYFTYFFIRDIILLDYENSKIKGDVMENKKQKNYRWLSFFSLIISIVFLTIIFAMYSSSFVIQNNANVKPNTHAFNVVFSSTSSGILPSVIVPIKSSDDIIAGNAVFDNTKSPIIKGLYARFTEPGQSVTYTFYAYNSGPNRAYLKSIIYSNVFSFYSTKVCIARNPKDQISVNSVCRGIYLKIKVGNEQETNGSVASISNHILPKNTSEKITATIIYDKNAGIPTGPFDVKFGDITLLYSSVD